eukprot:5562280-Pyramimonas_sp.AAC.1
MTESARLLRDEMTGIRCGNLLSWTSTATRGPQQRLPRGPTACWDSSSGYIGRCRRPWRA